MKRPVISFTVLGPLAGSLLSSISHISACAVATTAPCHEVSNEAAESDNPDCAMTIAAVTTTTICLTEERS